MGFWDIKNGGDATNAIICGYAKCTYFISDKISNFNDWIGDVYSLRGSRREIIIRNKY